MNFKIQNKTKWILLAIIIKALLFWFFFLHLKIHYSKEGKQQLLYGFVMKGHDTKGYVEPAENLFNGNEYASNGKPTSFRMPGFALIYGPLYYLFGSKYASVLFVILQFLIGAISAYYLAHLAFLLFNQPVVFNLTYFLYLFSSYVSIYDHYLLSESFTTALLIFSIYAFVKYLKSNNLRLLLVCSCLLGFAVLFRPAIIFIILIIGVILCFKFFFKQKIRTFLIIKTVCIFGLPISILLGTWIVRNFIVFDRFIPFVDHGIHKSEQAIFDLTTAQGANWYSHDGVKGKFFHWFFPNFYCCDGMSQYYDEEFSNANPFSEKYFTPDYDIDSLRLMRNYFWLAIDPYSGSSDSLKSIYDAKTEMMAKSFKKSYMKNHPIDYFILNKLILMKEMLFVTKSYAIPLIRNNVFDKTIRRSYLLYYYFIILSGLSAAIYLIFTSFKKIENILSILVLSFILFHAMISYVENRYLVPVYPFFCILSACFISYVRRQISR